MKSIQTVAPRHLKMSSLGLAAVLAFMLMLTQPACGTTSAGSHGAFEPFDHAVPDVALVDLDGKPRSLSEFRGKVVLLDFWATWCKPCAESLPIYDRWQAELGPKGLVVVTVSIDEADADVAGFAKKFCPNAVVLRNVGGKMAEALNLPTMPTAFIVDREGRITHRHIGYKAGDETAMRAALMRALAVPVPTPSAASTPASANGLAAVAPEPPVPTP